MGDPSRDGNRLDPRGDGRPLALALGDPAGIGGEVTLKALAALQQQQQAEIDAAQQAYREAQQFPIQQLQIPIQALGATPYGQTTTQTAPGPTSNPLLTGLGAAASAASLAASIAAL